MKWRFWRWWESIWQRQYLVFSAILLITLHSCKPFSVILVILAAAQSGHSDIWSLIQLAWIRESSLWLRYFKFYLCSQLCSLLNWTWSQPLSSEISRSKRRLKGKIAGLRKDNSAVRPSDQNYHGFLPPVSNVQISQVHAVVWNDVGFISINSS